jgi:hypothetical protein
MGTYVSSTRITASRLRMVLEEIIGVLQKAISHALITMRESTRRRGHDPLIFKLCALLITETSVELWSQMKR